MSLSDDTKGFFLLGGIPKQILNLVHFNVDALGC